MKDIAWHRPLLWLAGLMAALALVAVVGVIVDDRMVTGANLWLKPLKFALSIGIYSVTLAWLIGQLHRNRRMARIAGTISAVGLLIEMLIILGLAVVGETSHFNVTTPLHSILWAVMANSIILVWIMTLLVSIALFRNPLGDGARTLAIRGGAVIALVGMGLAFLMTSPTAAQLDDFQGIAGAHTVGLADGGPGLPLLGWSTVAGDLRIPHFIGMHALQAIPLALIALELLSTRWRVLAPVTVRSRLVLVAIFAYAGMLAVVTWQALIGQSIVRPGGPVLVAGIVVAVLAITAATLALRTPRGSTVSVDSARPQPREWLEQPD